MSIPAVRHWRALGTGVAIATREPSEIDRVETIAADYLSALDKAASRFRHDSEVHEIALGIGPQRISPLLFGAISTALRAARLTAGLVDPTVTPSLIALGYDADFDAIVNRSVGARPRFVPAQGWRSVVLDTAAGTVALPPGLVLDLGATAKALAADEIAAMTQAQGIGGVLINLGGDLAVAGVAPDGGWRVAVSDNHASVEGREIQIRTGGLATSSTAVRRWRRGTLTCHHIVDPRTGEPASGPWSTVSVAAASCVDANIASTAAIIMGADAPEWLRQNALPARLVDHSGRVVAVNGWPDEARVGAVV